MHNCSNCKESFDAAKNTAGGQSWLSIFTRPAKMLPLGDDIESFGAVKCPKCGHLENGRKPRPISRAKRWRIRRKLGDIATDPNMNSIDLMPEEIADRVSAAPCASYEVR